MVGMWIDLLHVSYFIKAWYTSHWVHIDGNKYIIIGIDHDTVCAGVVGNAIRHSTSFEAMRFCFGHVAPTVTGRLAGSVW